MKSKPVSAFKWISIILILAVVVTAVGCGKKETQTPTPTPTPASSPTVTATTGPTGQTGTLSNLEGDVQVLRQGSSSWIAANSGMKIGTGDGLKTGGDGYVLITFFDGSVMEVEADSEISVEELSMASGGSTTVRISQVIGDTINRVQNLVDSSSTYEVESVAGSAVVRGTVYKVHVNQYGEITHICIDNINQGDSQAHLVDLSGGGKTVTVPPDQSSCCWENGQPSNPFYTDPGDDPFNQDGASCYGYQCCQAPCYWIGEGQQGYCFCPQPSPTPIITP